MDKCYSFILSTDCADRVTNEKERCTMHKMEIKGCSIGDVIGKILPTPSELERYVRENGKLPDSILRPVNEPSDVVPCFDEEDYNESIRFIEENMDSGGV